jgi:hypothetical protein
VVGTLFDVIRSHNHTCHRQGNLDQEVMSHCQGVEGVGVRLCPGLSMAHGRHHVPGPLPLPPFTGWETEASRWELFT